MRRKTLFERKTENSTEQDDAMKIDH